MAIFDPENARAFQIACDMIVLENGTLFGDASPSEVQAEVRKLRARVDAFSAMLNIVEDAATMREGLSRVHKRAESVRRRYGYVH